VSAINHLASDSMMSAVGIDLIRSSILLRDRCSLAMCIANAETRSEN
jgi:hypothetical protein